MNTDLLSRLSAVTGPSREFDREICPYPVKRNERPELLKGGDWLYELPGHGGKAWDYVPRYTESIDAALTLLNDTWSWSLCSYETYYKAKIWTDIQNLWRGNGTTPAIALVIACLKAKEASKP